MYKCDVHNSEHINLFIIISCLSLLRSYLHTDFHKYVLISYFNNYIDGTVNSNDDDDDASVGAIVGSVFGVIAVILIILLVITG